LFNLFYAFALAVPSGFPIDTIVTLKKGAGLAELANELESENVIRSAFWFRAAVIMLGGERGIRAGDYYLRNRESGVKLAWRMVKGDHDLTTIKLTIPEGYTKEQIADLFDERFPFFNRDIFLSLAPEGYLFPDTYFTQVNITAGGAIELFQNNFENKIASLKDDIEKSEHTKEEIIIMASIIEAEVQSREDRELVSGILWKRISIGMALQVDPAPETYKEPGLPQKPINNPGLASIEAALSPKSSSYLYFLSGKDGKTYYAKTLEEHIQNLQKYR
jgi:UPF0755 protein